MPFVRAPIFFCEPTGEYAIHAQIYSKSRECPKGKYQGAHCRSEIETYRGPDKSMWDRRDETRPPQACMNCGQEITDDDGLRRSMTTVHRRVDTGEIIDLASAPIGAAWYVDYRNDRLGPDGKQLVIEIPSDVDGKRSHAWSPDDRASNCTRKDDNTHRCWVRHGSPRDGTLHVDKAGDTCAAGAGSIMAYAGWHGFITRGFVSTVR